MLKLNDTEGVKIGENDPTIGYNFMGVRVLLCDAAS